MDIKTVKDLAELAQLEVSEEAALVLVDEFDAILAYVDQLTKVSPDDDLAFEGFSTNALSSDSVQAHGEEDFLIESFPQRQNRFLKIQKIINNSDE